MIHIFISYKAINIPKLHKFTFEWGSMSNYTYLSILQIQAPNFRVASPEFQLFCSQYGLINLPEDLPFGEFREIFTQETKNYWFLSDLQKSRSFRSVMIPKAYLPYLDIDSYTVEEIFHFF